MTTDIPMIEESNKSENKDTKKTLDKNIENKSVEEDINKPIQIENTELSDEEKKDTDRKLK